MGVKGLGKLLSEEAEVSEHEFSTFCGTKQAIDTYGILYKFIISVRQANDGNDILTSYGKPVSHLYAIFHKVCCFLKYGIYPYFVFDGTPPKIKRQTLIDRRNIKIRAETLLRNGMYNTPEEKIKLLKKTVSIKEEQIKECQTLLSLLGLPYIQAIGEAEAQCAALSLANIVDGVVTEDYDALPFGSRTMLMNFSNNKQVKKINLEGVLNKLELTHDQFIDLCAILGNDFCKGIRGISPVDAYKKYKKVGTMELFLQKLKNKNNKHLLNGNEQPYIIPFDFEYHWAQSKNYYKHVRVLDPFDPSINIEWKEPNISKLYDFLCTTNEFDKADIKKKLNLIGYIYKRYKEHNCELSNRYFLDAIRYHKGNMTLTYNVKNGTKNKNKDKENRKKLIKAVTKTNSNNSNNSKSNNSHKKLKCAMIET